MRNTLKIYNCDYDRFYKCIFSDFKRYVSISSNFSSMSELVLRQVIKGETYARLDKWNVKFSDWLTEYSQDIKLNNKTDSYFPAKHTFSESVVQHRNNWDKKGADPSKTIHFSPFELCFFKLKSLISNSINTDDNQYRALDILCLMEIYMESYVKCNIKEVDSFFKISSKLPVEIKMRVANLVCNENKIFVNTKYIRQNASMQLFWISNN